ncbi:MAG: sensor histidine kinase [Blautia obeum]
MEVGATFNFMTGKIKEQIESLSNINRTQKQLIGSLAHELKTPMTAIIGYADTLLTVRLTPERQEKALIYIENECRRLSRLSMKMLELTGLYEASEDSFNPAEIQVDNFLKEVKELIDCRLQEKNISLDVFCEPKELVKKFDQDLMISVVTNLIDNAVKASRKESKIVLEATPDHLMVQDFGKGIPKEDLEMVTEPFYMVDKSRSRAKGSVGLGLSLCQKIIELHDFQLKIESNPGKGTTVSVFW